MIRYLVFSFSEAVTNLWRSRVLNLLSIGTIMLAMFILGAFLLLGHNLRHVSVGWEHNFQFHIFLADSITPQEREAIESYLASHNAISELEFLSKDQARSRFEQDFSGYKDISNSLSSNPFPASFKVKLVVDQDHDQLTTLRQDVEGFSGIDEVYYDSDVAERLSFLGRMVELAGWIFGAIMVFASVFTISNVLKLTFFARREEVDIMKLVGASRAYIRGPFLIEGFLQGLVGAAAGVTCLVLGFFAAVKYLENRPGNLVADLDLVFLPSSWLLALVAAGCLSGFVGAAFSLNQFLEEHISYQ